MKLFDHFLYPILNFNFSTDSLSTAQALIIDWQTFGIKHFQLRIKDTKFDKYRDLAHSIKQKFPTLHIIANDYADSVLFPEIFSGIHVGQADFLNLDQSQVKRLGDRPASMILGISTNLLIEFQQAADNPIGFDYIAVGPVFPTKSKIDSRAVPDQSRLEKIFGWTIQNYRKSIVLIGGINSRQIIQVADLLKNYFTKPGCPALVLAGIDMFRDRSEMQKISDLIKDWELTY